MTCCCSGPAGTSTIRLRGRCYHLRTTCGFQGLAYQRKSFNIRMPNDFVARTDEEIASVYALGSKPQYVYSNGYLGFMIAFNWTTNLISNDNIHDFTQFASRAIERTGPQCRILNTEKLNRPDCNLSILQFLAQTLDSVNMNVMFFASIEGRLLIGSITFNQKDANRLRPLAVEMAKSFHLNNAEEEQGK